MDWQLEPEPEPSIPNLGNLDIRGIKPQFFARGKSPA